MIDTENPIIVTMRHVRSANLCSRGTRAWFDRHNLDFNIFLSRGLPVEDIEGTKDELGLKVAAIARKEAE